MKPKKFDTQVQLLKYKVLREVARCAWDDTLLERVLDLPVIISPSKSATVRCCIYKERAILGERVKLAMGGDRSDPNVIQVIDIACDECPAAGYVVTDSCRGCLAHHCETACKTGAIVFDNVRHVALIDKSKCVECGACAKVCPYTAIINRKRPCQVACKVKAISMNEEHAATIDREKCTQCGACVYQCPFGAITDKSYILDVVELLKGSDGGKNYPVYAMVAPSISSQFTYARPGQVIAGLKLLGFDRVVEAALGADMVAMAEAKELAEKDFLTSSCCPSFVSYVKSAFPALADQISKTPSPMLMLAMHIKKAVPDARIVFIGPCTAKKAEAQGDEARLYVDAVITFEELQALFASRDIKVETLEKEERMDDASYYGRIFARSGGLTEALGQAIREQGLNVELDGVVCDGIEACRAALTQKSRDALEANFIEGMACVGGCIGGAGCLKHGEKSKNAVDDYGREATDQTIGEAVAHSM